MGFQVLTEDLNGVEDDDGADKAWTRITAPSSPAAADGGMSPAAADGGVSPAAADCRSTNTDDAELSHINVHAEFAEATTEADGSSDQTITEPIAPVLAAVAIQ